MIQHIRESSPPRSSYRLIGYGDLRTYHPVNFGSLDELLEVLKSAIPGFDVSSIARTSDPGGSILLAEVMELSDAQLSILGLRERDEFATKAT